MRLLALALLLLSALLVRPALADGVEDFYRGKSIGMLVASGVGGGYDLYARAFARTVTKHMPGNPVIVAKNMEAAGGLAAASTLYNNVEKDGLTIGALTNGVAMDPLFGNPGARFESQKFNWIGSIGKLENVCATWHTSPITNISQALEREVVVSGTGATTNSVIVPKILNALLGTKFKIVAGYDTAGLTMSVERGEVECICGLSWSTLKASRPDWISGHRLNVILQVALNKLADLPEVPSAIDLVTDPQNRRVLELILIRQEMGRPIVASPGVPKERIQALRRAFDETMKDPDFLAESQKQNLEIEPLTGAEIDRLLATAYGAPKEIVARAASLVEPGGK
jgi:tripartite-type tricarboxylate transporter receptor subunit TctC